MKMIFKVATTSLLLGGMSSTALSETVSFEKRDTSFSIDGGGGAMNGRQVYLWNTSSTNVNQQWEETQIGDFYQYKKVGTNHCLDGQGGGRLGQAVHLWSCSSTNINQQWEKIPQANGYVRLKKRGVSFSLDCGDNARRNQVCTLWSSQDSNVNQHFRLATIDGESDGGGNGDFNLNANNEPWENFDLREWKLDTPAGESSASDCDAQSTEPQDYANNFPSRSEPYFFTHSDGGMRFIAEYGGGTTGGDCSSKSRSELREMLRGSDTSIDTTGNNGDFRNNWALGSSNGEYQPTNADADETWGAREGTMKATLIINDVTESGSFNDQGNIVIGQIHASSDEPLRLHYRIRPGMTRGCIWAATEIRESDDMNINIIGDRDCDSDDGPSSGIELGQMFSYEIENDGPEIIVTIREGNRGNIIEELIINLDDLGSGYYRADEWMFFKAGVYSQNDDGDEGDRDIVTFYRLEVTH